jgi:membrane associated rhomboid family serine protease
MSMTKLLTIILIVVYALQCINDVYLKTQAERWLALTYEGVSHGWVWQLITFQFLHYNLMHVTFNLISFWFLGQFVENVLGQKRFLIALFGCGAIGGVLQGILMYLFPEHYGIQTVGASAGVAGIIAIFALLERDSEIRLNFIFPIKAIWLLWGLGGVSLFFTMVPTPREMNVAHAAHLGGILAGVAWVKLGWHRDYVQLPWEGWFQWVVGLGRNRSSRQRKAPKIESNPTSEASGETDFLKDEVDAVLDKISAQGIQSLTARERSILESARKKMSRK